MIGGLELSIKFAHHEDLDKVVHAARGVGWAPDFDIEHRDWESAGMVVGKKGTVSRSLTITLLDFLSYTILSG